MGDVEELEIKASFVVCTMISGKRICPIAIDLFRAGLNSEGRCEAEEINSSVRISEVIRENTGCLTFRYALALETYKFFKLYKLKE